MARLWIWLNWDGSKSPARLAAYGDKPIRDRLNAFILEGPV